MSIDELIEELQKIAARDNGDPENNHSDADDLLLKYINDSRVDLAFNKIEKWYA